MHQTAAESIETVAQRWVAGDNGVTNELLAFCLTNLQEFRADTVREWFSGFAADRLNGVPADFESPRSFSRWATERLKLFEADPYRVMITAAYNGDDHAFDRLYVLTRPQLTRTLRRFADSLPDDEISDIVGNFFTKLLFDIREGRRPYIAVRGQFMPWARTVVMRSALTLLREQKRLESLPEDNEASTELVVQFRTEDGSFRQWIRDGLSPEQRIVFDLLVMGCDQQRIASVLGCGSAKVSKMLDEIRARVAHRMQVGGYDEALNFALGRIRSGKAVKGLLPRLFLRFVVPLLLDTLQRDQKWAGLARNAFDNSPRELLWGINPENDRALRNVATKIANLYQHVESVDPGHAFCFMARKISAEPWGDYLAIALQNSAAQKMAAATADSVPLEKGGDIL